MRTKRIPKHNERFGQGPAPSVTKKGVTEVSVGSGQKSTATIEHFNLSFAPGKDVDAAYVYFPHHGYYSYMIVNNRVDAPAMKNEIVGTIVSGLKLL